MLFGIEKNKGLALSLDNSKLEVIDLEINKKEENRILVHDINNKTQAYLLAQMDQNIMPVALGVLYRIKKPTLDTYHNKRIKEHTNKIEDIIEKGQTWTI